MRTPGMFEVTERASEKIKEILKGRLRIPAIRIMFSPDGCFGSALAMFLDEKKDNDVAFNKDNIAEPYKNPTDKRILERIKNGSKGKTPYDVFQFNLVKNVSKDKTEHICQLPVQLLEIFVKASSNKGDIVFDPFMG